MLITRTSKFTQKTRTFDLNVTEQQLKDFENRRELGKHVQHIFPHLTASEREFIMTGVTDEEWEEVFSKDGEENY